MPRRGGAPTRHPSRLGGWSLDPKEIESAEQRKQRSAQQKLEIVLAWMRGDRSVRDVCREYDVSEALCYSWRDKILEGGEVALAGKDERQAEKELRKKVGKLGAGPGSQDL